MYKSVEERRSYQRLWYAKNKEKVCTQQREWRKNHPERHKATQKRYRKSHVPEVRVRSSKDWRKWRYGLTPEQFSELLDSCENRCLICRIEFSEKIKPYVDHCHKTKIVRGLLCRKCNMAEGALGSPEVVLRLYKYMLKNELFYQGEN
jgi:hypothetical protein